MKVKVIIPVLNAKTYLKHLLPALNCQIGIKAEDIFVIDSSSDDDTVKLFREYGAEVVTINREEFGHGKTRTLGAKLNDDYDILVYMTQDAIPYDEKTISNIVSSFLDLDVSIAYGRQLPRQGAGPIERHARYYNYPELSYKAKYEDKGRLGTRAFFCSNSFAAYRTSALRAVGYFPVQASFAEDQIVTANVLLHGGSIVYNAEAKVIHSHALTMKEEFNRYRMIGAAYSENNDLFRPYGLTESKGKDFFKSEMLYLMKYAPQLLPEGLLRTIIKYIAFKLFR